jgi:hypothetical protein
MIALLEWALLLFIGFFASMIHTYSVVAYFPKAKSTGAIVCSRHSFRSMHKKQSPKIRLFAPSLACIPRLLA